jgi:hypothetical protein
VSCGLQLHTSGLSLRNRANHRHSHRLIRLESFQAASAYLRSELPPLVPRPRAMLMCASNQVGANCAAWGVWTTFPMDATSGSQEDRNIDFTILYNCRIGHISAARLPSGQRERCRSQMTLSWLQGGFAPESWVREKTGAHQTSLHHAEQWPLRQCEPSYCVGFPGQRLPPR